MRGASLAMHALAEFDRRMGGWEFDVYVLHLQDTETYDLLHSLGFVALLNPIVHFGEASQRPGFRAHVHVQSMLFCMLHQVKAHVRGWLRELAHSDMSLCLMIHSSVTAP
jgi:hypothetical protein